MNDFFSYLCNNMNRLIILISSLLFAIPSFSQDSWLYEQCEDTCKHIHGIDISHYQGDIFWEAVGENHKMAYVYIKATEGGDKIDKRYADNIQMAKSNELKVGSYHFFRPKTPVHLQLDNFTTQCRPEDQDIIPMIDIETKGGLSNDAFIDSLTSFLKLVEEYYQQKPILYTGANFYDHYLSGGLVDEYKIMIAQYTEREPVLIDDRDITMWQYTAKGSINGVKGNVDKSRFMGNHGLREIRFRKQKSNTNSQ